MQTRLGRGCAIQWSSKTAFEVKWQTKPSLIVLPLQRFVLTITLKYNLTSSGISAHLHQSKSAKVLDHRN